MVFCDYYLPGFKSGGGMWTVVNLVDRFCDRYDFFIVTRNHDGKADKTPYTDVRTGEWNSVGNAKVFYVDRSLLNRKTFTRLISDVSPDIVFLNSVFSAPSITFSRSRKNPSISRIPVIISPCGELSPATLKLKGLKKGLFLRFAKLAGFYRNVLWRASFELDADEIRSAIGKDVDVLCAPDLPPKSIAPDFDLSEKPAKTPGSARFAFVSRIVRKKNLHYLFDRLSMCTGDILVDVVGPVEDKEYWRECQAAAKNLPPNVEVNIVGAVTYQETLSYMRSAHFFALPTLSENFGYVFLEALACGCPLLISDRTVWNEVAEKNAGWVVPIEDPTSWERAINHCVGMDQKEFSLMATAARQLATQWLADPENENATARLLATALRN